MGRRLDQDCRRFAGSLRWRGRPRPCHCATDLPLTPGVNDPSKKPKARIEFDSKRLRFNNLARRTDAATRAARAPSAHTADRNVACRTAHIAAWRAILRVAFWPASFAPARAPPRRPRLHPGPAAHSSPPELPPTPRRWPDAGRPTWRPTRRRTNLSSRHAPAPASRLAAGLYPAHRRAIARAAIRFAVAP